LLSKPIIEIDM